MNTVVHEISLRSERHFQGKLPPYHLGLFLADLPLISRDAVSMAIRKRSAVQGRRPRWLDRAADIRFVGHQGNDETTLFFEAPRLGEAAHEVYAQQTLSADWDQRPSPDDTAFDLLGDILTDVRAKETDSDRFDPPLLNRITRFQRVFRKSPFSEVSIASRRYPVGSQAIVSPGIVHSAKILLGKTPASQRVRIVGQLDGLVASTQRFSLLLDSGEKISGVFAEDQIDALQDLWRKRVLVLGTAVYRASGRLLRIDAEIVKPGENETSVFSRIPASTGAKLDTSKLRKPQGPKSGISAIIGKWPGDETEEEITTILAELS